jgi:hypothetical protein
MHHSKIIPALFFALLYCIQSLPAQEVTAKFTSIKNLSEFNLYNEKGIQVPVMVSSDIKIGPKRIKSQWTNSFVTDTYMVYNLGFFKESNASMPLASSFFPREVEAKIIEDLFHYKSMSRGMIAGASPINVPEHFFDGDGDGGADLRLSYIVEIDNSSKYLLNNYYYNIYQATPVITIYRKSMPSIQSAVTAEKICFNNTPSSKTLFKADFNDAIRVQTLRINSKDLTPQYDPEKGIETFLNDVSTVKIAITDKKNYVVEFEVPVLSNGPLSQCPVATITGAKVIHSLAAENGLYKKLLQLDVSVAPVNKKSMLLQNRVAYLRGDFTASSPSVTLRMVLTDSSRQQALQFNDQWNQFSIPISAMQQAWSVYDNTAAFPLSAKLYSVSGDGVEMINDSTIRIVSDSSMKNGGKKIMINQSPQFEIAKVRADKKELNLGVLTVTEEMNGSRLELAFEDQYQNVSTWRPQLLIRDKETIQRTPLTPITADSVYMNYFKSMKIFGPKGKFVWVTERGRKFLDNTTMDLTRPFVVSYKMNDASRVPDFVFGPNPQTDFLRIHISGDSAILQEEHADGTILPKGFIYPLAKTRDKTILIERRNNYLAEGIAGRRDYLLVNDKPFIHFKISDLSNAYNSRIGFDLVGKDDYKFNEVLLSGHNYREVKGEKPEQPITLHGALTRYLTNTEPVDSIDYETDEAKKKELFDQLSENSYVLIISNYDYKISRNDFPAETVTAVRDELVAGLQYFQFKPGNIVLRDNLTYDSLRKIFTFLLGGGSMNTPASLEKIKNIFPGFNSMGRNKANIYIHYIGHASVNGLSPVDITDDNDAFPINDWLRKFNTGEASAIKNFLFVQDACYNSISNIVPLAYSDNLVDHALQYDANTTGRELILASKETPAKNFNLTRSVATTLEQLSLESGPFSTKELFPRLKTGSSQDILNYGFFRLPFSQERIGSFIFYPKFLITTD